MVSLARGCGSLVVVALALAGTTARAARSGERFWTDAREQTLHTHHSIMGQVAKSALPAVVSITTVDAKDAKPSPNGEPQHGVGAGFVIHPDGYILTCAHVIDDALDIRVTLLSPKGYPEEYAARVVGRDPQTDFALLKVEPARRLPVLKLGTAKSVDVADWVVVIGSPFGLSHSVSVGVVSYKGRSDVTPNGRNGYFDYLQTDAAINPGNSGGPVLDIDGNVVAVANAVNVSGQGIGFAVPVDIAKAVLPDLKEHGEVRRGWMGISVQELTPDVARRVGVPSFEGVLVSEVVEGSPAYLAGVRSGDVITRLATRQVHHASEMRWRVATAGIGQELRLNVQRAGHMLALGVRLKAPPDSDGFVPALDTQPDAELQQALRAKAGSTVRRRPGLPALAP